MRPMTKLAYDPKTIGALPRQVALFPLSDVLLLPGGRVPLTIFEPRYVMMLRYAFRQVRHIGMIRPLVAGGEKDMSPTNIPPLHPVGCLGRIVYFEELADGRFRIDLKGVARFRIEEEFTSSAGFRIAKVGYDAFAKDVQYEEFKIPDRRDFLDKLKGYMQVKSLGIDWQSIDKVPDETLLVSLAQAMPFTAPEKQGLLEYRSKDELHQMLSAMFELTAVRQNSDMRVN